MRKNLVIFGLIAGLTLSTGVSFAQGITGSCPSKPYPISNSFSRGLQGILGLNFMASKIVEGQIKSQISKYANGDFKVNFNTYSVGDLAAGKFKGINIKGKDIVMQSGLRVSSVNVSSPCDFVYLDIKNKPVKNISPVLMNYNVVITQDDLNKTIKSPQYKDNFQHIKTQMLGLDIGIVDLVNPKFEIKNSKLYFTTDMHFGGTPDFMTVPVKIGTGFTVKNGKLTPVNLELVSKVMGGNSPFLSEFLSSFSANAFDVNNFLPDGMNVNFTEADLSNGKLSVSGNVYVSSQTSKK